MRRGVGGGSGGGHIDTSCACRRAGATPRYLRAPCLARHCRPAPGPATSSINNNQPAAEDLQPNPGRPHVTHLDGRGCSLLSHHPSPRGTLRPPLLAAILSYLSLSSSLCSSSPARAVFSPADTMVHARLTRGAVVASGCLLVLATAGSASASLSRFMMPPAMHTIRTIVAEQQAADVRVSSPSAGASVVKEARGAVKEEAAAPSGAGGADEFDPEKLIKLGDIDDNGAADYAYVTKAADGTHGGSLHLFLFGTSGQVISDRAVALGASASDRDAVIASVSTKLSSLDEMRLSVRPSLPTPSVRATNADCLFTSTECECDLKSAIHGSGTCYSHVDTTGDRSRCIERDCSASYVCVCGGSQKCSRSTITSPVWVPTNSSGLPAGETYCERRRVAQALTEVVGPMPTPVPTPPPAGCTLTADRCTCGLKSVVSGKLDVCAVHTGLDADGRDVCGARDCKDGYVCDCAGSSKCAFESVTKEFWRIGGAAPGGRNYCERASKTAVVAVCLENC